MFSTGVYVPGVGITEGFLEAETLNANGFFQFANSGDTTPPVVTISSDPIGVITNPADQPVVAINIADQTPRFPVGTAISVVGPQGQALSVFQTFGGNNPDGSLFVSFLLNVFGGPLTPADNGVYEIRLNENTVGDAAGNFAPDSLLGTFVVSV